MKTRSVALFFLLLSASAVFSKKTNLKPGYWYATLQLSQQDFLPFIIEFEKGKNLSRVSVINGSERIILDQITVTTDSIFLSFPAFASEIRAKILNKTHISGNWYNHAKKGNYLLPFDCLYEARERFVSGNEAMDVSGHWEVTFDYDGEPEKSVGIFKNDPSKGIFGSVITNRVTGTFLTETGDYRFLEGATIKDSLYLSTFDGSHAFLFKAQFMNDTLWGEFLSGKHYKAKWYAFKNADFKLGHPDSLTTFSNDSPISFSLTNVDGSTYTYPNQNSTNKITLIQIMGTWCPNCLDESLFLKELYTKYPEEINIVAVSFETQTELQDKIKKVASYKANLDLPYTFVIGGDACKSCATDLFPNLSNIISFPTLIFIDKKGNIRKVHTGFNGPGTGVYYTQFVSTTNTFIEQLIQE